LPNCRSNRRGLQFPASLRHLLGRIVCTFSASKIPQLSLR
jgi:hypothetical protein